MTEVYSSDEESDTLSVNSFGYTALQNALSLEDIDYFREVVAYTDTFSLRREFMFTTVVPPRTVTRRDGTTRTFDGYTTETCLQIAERYVQQYRDCINAGGLDSESLDFNSRRYNEWIDVSDFIRGVVGVALQ